MVRATRENNRSQMLLDAAAELFATQGYAATTVRDITSAIGMASGSSYYHFRTKAEMLLAFGGSAPELAVHIFATVQEKEI
ncbi:MAG: helix-turn-helix domain-containing protein, partial [Actinomycetota bacterium]